jgi:putative acetyltransferase
VLIRPERREDHQAVADLVRAAFGSPREVHLVDAIRASEHYIPDLALVAEVEGRVVGHVMVSGAALQSGEEVRPLHTLSPLAVAPDHQRQGIGAALVREVLARAEARGIPAVVLEGDPAYYGRFGFEPASRYGIDLPLPAWAPGEAAQVARLRDYDPSLRGRVVYPAAFGAVAG